MCHFRAEGSRDHVIRLVVSLVSWVPFVLTLAGCSRPVAHASIDDEARRYVRLAVALGERDPDSLDFYSGPADFVADVRRSPSSLEAIRADAAALAARLSADSAANDPVDAERKKRIAVDLAALQARVDLLLGARWPFDKESATFFGLAPGVSDTSRSDEIRSRVAEIVGRSGRLVDRYSAFADRFTIPGERLPAVMRAAMEECRRSTTAHLPLPAAEQVSIEFVRDRPWSAFSRYQGEGRSVMQVNTDFRFTVDQALQVACHEGYPGHHTRNVLLTSAPQGAARWPERWVQLTFSRASLVSEAAGMMAVDVAFPPAERSRVVRERLCPLANVDPRDADRHVSVERLVGDLQVLQADIARRYIDGELEFARAVTALEEQALVPHAEAAIKYVNEYRSYVSTYTAGRTAFAARLAECTGVDATDATRWRCFRTAMLKPEL